MTTDEMHDELAGLLGRPVGLSLDSLAAIWERELKGWEWTREYLTQDGDPSEIVWMASSAESLLCPKVHDTGNFTHDFLALTLAAVKAKKGCT